MKKVLILSSVIFLSLNSIHAKDRSVTEISEDTQPTFKTEKAASSKKEIEKLTDEMTKLQLKLQILEAKAKIAEESGEYEKSEMIEQEVKKTESRLKKVFIKTASILGTLGGTVGATLTTFIIALITSWIRNFAISSISNATTPNDLETNPEHFHFHCPGGDSEFRKTQLTEIMRSELKDHLMDSENDRNEIAEGLKKLENLPVQNPLLSQIKSTLVSNVINYGIQAVIFTLFRYKMQTHGLK